jgi:TP901 family phage tail tape measure protein
VAEQLGQAVLTISADTRQLDAGLQRARQQAEALRGAFAQIAGGLSIAGSLAFVGSQIKELDAASAAVRTLGVNSDDLATKLKALSLELGSSVSQIQLTKAAYDVASSGFADAASAAQVLKASALGAQGGFAQLDDVVRAVTGVLNAYGLSADKATGIVDQFLQTQNDGVITVRQYAAEIGNIASIAAAGGVGLDQLNAAVATATLRGVPVAQTFTGLRQALSSIIKPSQQAAELAASLGLQFNVSALQSKGLAGVLADVQRATGGSADKIAILLGSVEAQAAVQPLLNDRLAKYNELLAKQANANGAAAAAAEINATTISGGLARIGNGFSNLATSLDKTLNPLLGGFIKSINEILVKLNQVAAVAPDRVLAREKEATDIVQQAIGPFGGSGFFGGVTVKYNGKTYKGSATGVRNDIINDLLQQELAAVNKAAPTATGGQARATPQQQAAAAGPVISPAQANFIQQTAAVELRGLQEKLEITRQLAGLNEAERTRLQNRLALNDKIRAVQQTQLQLDQELAKPKGSTGSPTEQDPAKLLDLQNKVTAGQVEVATLRLQNQQADAAALRTQQDRLRGQSLEAANARAKLGATQQQTQLERQALATGQEVSRTQQVQLQQWQGFAAAVRQRNEAQRALNAELRKPAEQQDRVVLGDLFSRVAEANRGVRQAYADAGLALVQNARSAADALRSAQQSFNSAARGGFNLLTPQLQQQQIQAAQASVQRAVNAGLIRIGVDISTPERLFQVAGFAEQIIPAQKQLEQAIKQNADATAALAQKDWSVYVSVPGQPTFVPLSNK